MPSIETIHPVTVKEIGTIDINATLNFKDGDKPVFTGTTPENAKYMLVFEEWRTDGGDGLVLTNGLMMMNIMVMIKTITTFDKNKTYHYNLFVQPTHNAGSEGWVFGPHTKLIINGKEVTYV